jgi:hypothetical protein
MGNTAAQSIRGTSIAGPRRFHGGVMENPDLGSRGCHPGWMRRVFASLLVTVFVAAACGDDEPTERQGTTRIDITTGPTAVESVGLPVELPVELAEALVDQVRAYVKSGVVRTLRTGEPGDLAQVFDDAALASLESDEGAAMLDRGAPAATGDILASAEPVVLTGLADATGGIVLVSAHLDLEVVSHTEGGALTITRVGDLTFAPAGDHWKITAFRVGVSRAGAGVEEVAEARAP